MLKFEIEIMRLNVFCREPLDRTTFYGTFDSKCTEFYFNLFELYPMTLHS